MLCPDCQKENEAGLDVCFFCGRPLLTLTQGSILGSRYEIQSVLGRGGMGLVYQALDTVLDEPVAIKVLRSDLGSSDEMTQRFRSEIKLARKVSHPNVSRIHDYGEHEGFVYISMMLLEGRDLKQLVDDHPYGLPPEEAFDAAIQAADGLRAIHEAGIIHRDLKTPNIMRGSDGVVRLMDFGIAKEAKAEGSMTATGQVMGSPEYMSPEQCCGEALDARTDLYSLGVVLWEVFTGEVPFRGDTLMATLFKHIREPPPFDEPSGARLPAALVPVLEKALAKPPSDRFDNAEAMLEALREARSHFWADVESGEEPPAPPEPPCPPPVAVPLPVDVIAEVAPGEERRCRERLVIPLDLKLKRLDSAGGVLQEERTIAENISREGVRVMTAMSELAVGQIVAIEEVGGDFQTQATVRYEHTGADHVRRLGLELLDELPDRLLPSDDRKRRRKEPEASSAAAPPATEQNDRDRRSHSRLGIHFDLVLRRLDESGEPVQEERTVAENISRGGMRVPTSMDTLEVGDRVEVEEIGGDFKTRALVRNKELGADRVPRLGLQFTDRTAPDRLVPDDELSSTRRTRV